MGMTCYDIVFFPPVAQSPWGGRHFRTSALPFSESGLTFILTMAAVNAEILADPILLAEVFGTRANPPRRSSGSGFSRPVPLW